MSVPEQAVQFIKQYEGFAPKLYRDTTHMAIGYGCNLTDQEAAEYQGREISEQEADAMLRIRLDVLDEELGKLIKVPISDGQRSALLSFAYNLGIGALKGSTLLAYLNASSYNGAALQFSRWNKMHTPTGEVVQNKALAARRNAEMRMFVNAPNG